MRVKLRTAGHPEARHGAESPLTLTLSPVGEREAGREPPSPLRERVGVRVKLRTAAHPEARHGAESPLTLTLSPTGRGKGRASAVTRCCR